MKRSLFAELRRRNVLRMAGLYVVGSWLITQVTGTVLPMFEAPSWLPRSIVMLLAIGFVPTMMFSWIYELTPEGLKRDAEVPLEQSIAHETGRRIDRMIITTLALALVYFAVDKFLLAPRREAAQLQQQAELLRQGQKTAGDAAAATAQAVSEHSIAVLPFVNMSDEKSNEFFSDGISEELLNLLAKIPQLQVTARTSSFAFKGKEIGITEVARQLHVAHVLEGSVRKSGNAVRITAQLINAATDTHLWSQTYDRKLDDIFAIQDEIAADVVKQLKVTLLGAAPKARTTDPEAYALYLQAKQLGWQFTAEAFKQSDALYRKALAIDPRYAPAWAGLSSNFANETGQALLSNKEGHAQAREAATKALAIDPDYAPAHARLGWIAMTADNDLAGAAQHFNSALALDPSDLDVLRNSATLLQSLGRLDEALALSEAVVRRDPVNVSAIYNLGISQRDAGRLDASIGSFRTVLSLAPSRGNAHANLGIVLLLKGDASGALAEIERETSEVWKMINLPLAYHALGRKADSDAALAALMAKEEKDSPYNIAYVYAYRGEADKAFEWLDKAVEYGDPGIGEIVTESLFDKIHADPRWQAFLRKVGKAPEQLAKIEFKVTLPQADGNTASGQAEH
ncbi:MAG TPA: tetratricopeptide repeat protein [Rudaea sp.]|nr:tetratricopeptide repeat protein [Rudaea sp.]